MAGKLTDADREGMMTSILNGIDDDELQRLYVVSNLAQNILNEDMEDDEVELVEHLLANRVLVKDLDMYHVTVKGDIDLTVGGHGLLVQTHDYDVLTHALGEHALRTTDSWICQLVQRGCPPEVALMARRMQNGLSTADALAWLAKALATKRATPWPPVHDDPTHATALCMSVAPSP